MSSSLQNWTEVQNFIQENLKPIVSTIDQEAYYPSKFLKELGKKEVYSVSSLPSGSESHFLHLIEEVGKVCGTTAFSIWCHAASILYVRNGNSSYIKEQILPQLERGEVLGGTGLSNPMKYYAGMEELRLTARREGDGYRISGVLPFVSNLGSGHWFGIIAQVSDNQRIVALVPTDVPGLSLTEITDFIGLNGRGTYKCCFHDVWIPQDYILSEDADQWVPLIRPQFVLLQIGIALGIIQASTDSIQRLKQKQGGVNGYMHPTFEELEQRLDEARKQAYLLAENTTPSTQYGREILDLRLAGAYLVLESTNAAMLHSGAAGYIKQSDAYRRLREAHFIASVTPAIKQLEKIQKIGWERQGGGIIEKK